VDNAQVQWKRQVNILRYLYRELELIEEVVEWSTPQFLQYYREFCAHHDIQPQRGPPGTETELSGSDPALPAALTTQTSSREYMNDDYGNWEERGGEIEEMGDLHKTFNKIFKNLAYHLHPDRLPHDLDEHEKESRLRMFKKALQALEDKHYFRLVTMAEQFGIETPEMDGDHILWLKQEVDEVRQTIGKIQGTYNYHFSECKTAEQKEQLMKSFIMQNFNIEV
jgi:hypothetical protein